MTTRLFQNSKDSRILFDAIPSPAFVVDDDVRIMDMNRAAVPFMGHEPQKALLKKGGDALRCIQAEDAPHGCGSGEACKRCVVRNSVKRAMNGRETVRERVDMRLVTEEATTDLHLLVTVSPFQYEQSSLALLMLEDITELAELRQIIPICANCRKVRNDNEYRESVEAYLVKHSHIRFTHGICPECARMLYPSLYKDDPAA